ncbi:hypothetical protein Pint_10614 [Pistacia integerrima]|uniref:Uncharacterized protein n=1 Tax=Pistacia integerrima TaxID=434235 RepID=A0ACC0XLE2_9ROSI|nr:hypothetical protein Pint_10614 [Pistacia integerrima]
MGEFRILADFLDVLLSSHPLPVVLVGSGALPREPMPSNVTVRLPSLEELEAYAVGQWECFLLQLISSSQAEKTTNFSSSMMKVFQRGLLTQRILILSCGIVLYMCSDYRDKESPRLTESGFQFLLMDTNAQLWYIVREYITNSQDRGVSQADLISFLLELSFHVAGEAYNINTLSDPQRNMIKDFADLGLVKLQQGRKDSWFIPTKLATNLSVSLTESSSRKEVYWLIAFLAHTCMEAPLKAHDFLDCVLKYVGFVVVETNFRMYAYSTSKLHCEILRLFSRIEYQLPNLIVGAITKESLYNAFENGITAEQIISFLQQNAHPRVAERIPSVPENVCDQMRLWESDLNRVEMTLAYFYDEFPSRDIFEAACEYARERGSLLWEDSKRMRLSIKAEIHMNMREFLRAQNN